MGSPAESGSVGMSAVELADAAQLVATPGGEDTLLSLASMIEKHQPWPRHTPL